MHWREAIWIGEILSAKIGKNGFFAGFCPVSLAKEKKSYYNVKKLGTVVPSYTNA